MMDLILSPLGAFFILLAFSALLFAGAGKMAARGVDASGKGKMYACGEDMPAKKYFPSARTVFHIGLFFTLMEVFAMTVATLPAGEASMVGLVYIAGVSLSVFALFLR